MTLFLFSWCFSVEKKYVRKAWAFGAGGFDDEASYIWTSLTKNIAQEFQRKLVEFK